jgi:ectoine hydroxylase-related dioxygenase (phytanoyl-CoA dioxygenase family)
MENKFYGVSPDSIKNLDQFQSIVEEISILGYSVIENVLTQDEISLASSKLDHAYEKQLDDFGRENLKSINELNLVRCPLSEDEFFLQIATKPLIMEIARHFLGNYFIINQQNGIINSPREEHHQSSWHRDLPYQDYVISQPIAISCLICIDDFTEQTGSTYVLPFSHQLSRLPSVNFIKKHMVSSHAKKGSAIIFNAMLYHKAGYNASANIRRGLNTLYSIPLLKQQVNLLDQLKGKYADNPELSKLLGYDSQVPGNVVEWRRNRLNRKK